jgi:uncharacterized membrane protein
MVESTEPNQDESRDQRETGRLEAFSDGVFAIAITLLILQIPIPERSAHLFHDVAQSWPSFVAYALSFVVILIMWVNHHTVFRLIDRVDRRFLMLNGLLLMMITFVNYPTALVASYLTTAQERAAILLYSGTFVIVALCFNAFWRYASYRGRLISPHAEPAVVAAVARAYRFGPLLYLVAFLIAFVNAPLSLMISGGLAIYYAVYGLRTDPHVVPDRSSALR